MRLAVKSVLVSAALAVAAVTNAADAASPASCDRACLEGLVDRYLDAMVAHNPSKAPFAREVRFTENGQEMPIGGALWQTASGRGRYKLYVTDPEEGQVGFIGTVVENGTPAILGLRLKITGGQITEAESVVGRSKEGAERLDSLQVDPLLIATVPAAKRLPAAELRRIANLYFEGIQGGDPTKDTPFSDDCYRLENGALTTSNPEMAAKARASGRYSYSDLGCAAQFKTGYFKIVTEARERRFPVVDLEHQTVLSFAFFDHAGNVKQVTLSNGQTVPVHLLAPFTWELAELFHIEDGKLRRIEAVLNSAPYRMKSGWAPADTPAASAVRTGPARPQ